jgi:uncharacterized membrane protein YhiD involved in acid resistance
MNFTQFVDFNNYFDMANMAQVARLMTLDMAVLIVMSGLLSFAYIKTAQTLSNRQKLAAVFPLLSLTTMMIIGVIKSSLALSLGLVGALSIVRFRAAIKEPEELAYIFLAISLGLGIGAGQRLITITFFALMMLVIFLRSFVHGKLGLWRSKAGQALYLQVNFADTESKLQQLISVIQPYCTYLELKRHAQDQQSQRYLFMFKTQDYQQLAQLKQDLLALDQIHNLSVLNDQNLFS